VEGMLAEEEVESFRKHSNFMILSFRQ